jgi:hypothetical protein
MKQFGLVLLATALGTGVAHAGVVVQEQQITDHGTGTPTTNKITVMVQGNKQKYVLGDGKQSSITDLDKGTRVVVLESRKSYMEMPFPPQGMHDSNPPSVTFKKIGSQQSIAGYSCDDYVGTGSVPGGDMKVEGCFSTTAPGAANFTDFQRMMAEKVKGTPLAIMSQTPPGIPLKVDTTLTPKIPGRPPMTAKMTVTKVAEENLSADAFEAPKGYTKQTMPMMMGHMPPPGMMGGRPQSGGPGSSPATAPSKVPE